MNQNKRFFGKKRELVDEPKLTKFKYLALTKTTKKGQGCEIDIH